MLFRRTSSASSSEAQRPRQRTDLIRNAPPAFSYYANRQAIEKPAQRESARRGYNTDSPRTDQSRTYDNALYHRLRQLPLLLMLIVVAACLIKLLTLSVSPRVVLLNTTPVTEAYTHPAATYQAAAAKLLRGSLLNRFKPTVNNSGIIADLKQRFPELQTVSFNVPVIGSKPVLYLVPAQPSVLLQSTAGQIYAVGAHGRVLARLSGQPVKLPLLQDQSDTPVQVGRQALSSQTITFVQTIAYQLKAGNVAVESFILPAHSPYELDMKLAGRPFVVRFNLQGNALEQAGGLLAMLHTIGSTTPGSYIDMRVPGRVYYK